jgi:hypothetical protein
MGFWLLILRSGSSSSRVHNWPSGAGRQFTAEQHYPGRERGREGGRERGRQGGRQGRREGGREGPARGLGEVMIITEGSQGSIKRLHCSLLLIVRDPSANSNALLWGADRTEW